MLHTPCTSQKNGLCTPLAVSSAVAKTKENAVFLHCSQLEAITKKTSTIGIKINLGFQIKQYKFSLQVHKVAPNLHLIYRICGRNVY